MARLAWWMMFGRSLPTQAYELVFLLIVFPPRRAGWPIQVSRVHTLCWLADTSQQGAHLVRMVIDARSLNACILFQATVKGGRCENTYENLLYFLEVSHLNYGFAVVSRNEFRISILATSEMQGARCRSVILENLGGRLRWPV